MSSLPPDPWKVLGIEKSADKSEIRTAYRKLVLKCHPDKVQDPTLKSQKQDEFQKVQQAYELLNDDNERTKYEEQVKLAEMRKQAMLSKNIPNTSASRTPPRSSHTYFEVRTVEPHDSRFRHASPHNSPATPKVNVYTHVYPKTKSYEDEVSSRSQELYDEDRRARRAASYDQPSRRDEEKREDRRRRDARDRKEEEERDRERERREKELRKQDRREREKVRDKEKRRDVEDKSFRRAKGAYVEEYDRDEVYAPSPKTEKKKVSSFSSSKQADELPVREKSSSRRERDESPRVRVDKHAFLKEEAAAYIEQRKAKYKGASVLPRSHTFQEPPTYTRVPSPPAAADYIDDDAPRRSSARPSRRSSHDMTARSKEKLHSSSQKKSREDIEVIDTSARAERPGPPRAGERIIPKFEKMSSAPPLSSMTSPPVPESPPRRPTRQNTVQEPVGYARPHLPPKLPRAQTFGGEKTDRYRPPLQVMVGEVEENSEDERDPYERPRRHRTRRTHSPEPVTTRRYKHSGGVTTPIEPVLYEQPDTYDHHDEYRSSRRHGGSSSYGPKVEMSRHDGPGYYYEPSTTFPKVKVAKVYTDDDVMYSDMRYPPSQGNWGGVVA
ncbi:hypothetical protein GE09DRAFT_1222724 [Coniochaeta sp. 2T2.1]|nr:hypothetical protein GE09DRAFT_1222724 [Coniochaeta sp. 2T2.1]